MLCLYFVCTVRERRKALKSGDRGGWGHRHLMVDLYGKNFKSYGEVIKSGVA